MKQKLKISAILLIASLLITSIIATAIAPQTGATGKVNGVIVDQQKYIENFKKLHNGTPTAQEIKYVENLQQTSAFTSNEQRMYVSPLEFIDVDNKVSAFTYYIPTIITVWNQYGPVSNTKVSIDFQVCDTLGAAGCITYPTIYKYTDVSGTIKNMFINPYIINGQYVSTTNIYQNVQMIDTQGKNQFKYQELDGVPTDD